MEKRKNRRKDQHTIVAIGASAGGLEAINTFFDHLGDVPDHSFIIIQHLSSDHKSFLTELVAKHTAMKVVEAGNNMAVKKQHVYVIPSRMMITISDGQLNLLEKSTDHIPNNAIDIFLKSLAEERGEDAVAIILSGTGTDGTKGIDYIKAGGGKVLVQDPLSARFDGMPNSAILSGNTDIILEPAAMPAWLELHTGPKPEKKEVPISEEQLQQIFTILSRQGGYDFHYYKTPTIIRRINKRMNMTGYETSESYLAFIEEDRQEALELSKELFINVTSFFRDKAAFDLLYSDVIPGLIRSKRGEGVIKIWVCACSTGEEAYSIALLFDKYIEAHRENIEVKIFATDIDENNILFAGRNSYPVSIEKSVPQDMLQRYFVLEHNRYSVIPRIRKQIVFARHNVIKDPAFIKNDMITCRNMLIYMNRILQEKIMATFHFSLNASGYLFLGSSESAMLLKDGFKELSSKWKIYTRHNKKLTDMSLKLSPGYPMQMPGARKADNRNSTTEELGRDFLLALSEQVGYTALFIDARYEIKEAIGSYSRYLSLPQEKLNLNLLSMLPEELSAVLENAIKRAWFGKKNVTLQHVPFPSGKTRYVDILVRTAAPPNEHLTMILLGPGRETAAPAGIIPVNTEISDQNEYVKALEAQLTDSRDNLQLAIEGLETTNEELQSANEELLSSNEELQSSNEELQSLNEELHTLNTEHQAKIKELIELNDDLDNYLKSTEVGHIFLDAELRIRKFNPDATKFINLIESDIGRPVNHISNNLKYPQLQADIQEARTSNKMQESEISLVNGGYCIVRIYPYLRKDKIIDGIVLSFIDVTDVKNLFGVVNGVFDSSLNAIIVLTSDFDVLDHEIVDFRITAVNYAAEELLGGVKDKLKDQSFKKVAPHLLQHGIYEKLLKVARTGISVVQEYYYETARGEQSYDISAVRINNGIMITYADITQKKNAEKRLKKNYNELIVTRESLKELNVRLEEEVAERTRELSMSEERFRLVSRATNDVIKDWDLVNNKVWNSESFFSLFHFTEEDVVTNIDFWFGHIHPQDIEQVKQGIFNAINTGVPQWIGEYRFRNGNDHYDYVLERGYILKDEAGMPYRLISSLMDITALKKAEEATRELLQKKDEFMSIASHELKTPITSMKASLQIVERIIEENDQRDLAQEFIRKANDQVDKLTTLVENLLDVTKIQAGKMSFNKSAFEISELVEECVYHIQNLSRNPIRITGNPPLKIFADQNRIEQVILNFLSNAVKYSPDATEIILESRLEDDTWKITVSDHGIGIGADNLPQVFDRFFRGISSSEKFSGLGLGLYISADIVHRHGGEIGVESKLGEGSTFWFTLPLNNHSTQD